MKSRIRALSATALASTIGLVGNVPHASAKAEHCQNGMVTVEAVISQIDATDNSNDTDFNFFLRPLAPNEGTAFPNVPKDNFLDAFWNPSCDVSRDWVHKEIAPKMPVNKPKSDYSVSKFSEECKQCAGADLACKLDANATFHSCPKFFSCPQCVWDLRRLDGYLEDGDSDHLSNYTPKAEVFIADPATCSKPETCYNDFNDQLTNAMTGLGVGAPTYVDNYTGWVWTESLQVFCKEFAWDKGKWNNVAAGICGKHVLLTGLITFDKAHYGRPEIHPLSRMLVAWEKDTYKAGAFIDGSTDGVDSWATDFRVLFGKPFMPEAITLPLAQLQAPAPSKLSWGGPWVSACSVEETSKQNASLQGDTACANRTVKMDFDGLGGAAWSGELKTGWKKSDVSFSMNATLLTPGGVLDYQAPTLTTAKPPPGTAPACDVRVGLNANKKGLQRWYLWKVETDASVTNIPSDKVSWKWTTTPSEKVTFNPQPATAAPLGKHAFAAWFSAPAVHAGEVKATLAANGDAVAAETRALNAVKPSVKLKTTQSKSAIVAAIVPWKPASIAYTTSLSAQATGLCGATKDLRYVWKKNGKLLDVKGPGPIKVSLGPGGQETYEVSVFDPWDVELVVDAIVIEAPTLEAEIKATCADDAGSLVKMDVELPAEFKNPLNIPQQKVCKHTKLTAVARNSEGRGAIFPQVELGTLKYQWTDLKYASKATFNKFVAIPPEWLGTKASSPFASPKPGAIPSLPPGSSPWGSGGLPGSPWETPWAKPGASGTGTASSSGPAYVTVAPTPMQYVHLQATVSVSDAYGRAAIVNFVGSNDFTPLSEIAAAVESMWKVIGRRGPMPAPVPMLRLTGGGIVDPSPMDRWFSTMAWRAKTVRPRDTKATDALRKDFAALRDFAIVREMKDKYRRDISTLAAPQFTRKPARRISDKSQRAHARSDAWKRVQSDPATRDRFRDRK